MPTLNLPLNIKGHIKNVYLKLSKFLSSKVSLEGVNFDPPYIYLKSIER